MSAVIVEFKQLVKPKLKRPVLVEGFPGVGMVGTISSAYLAEKMQMTLVGYIQSSHFPPIAAIHNFIPVSPARIYASEKYDLIVLFSEFIIPAEVVYELSQRILQFAKENNASAIYSLAGIATPKPDQRIYGIASTKKMGEQLKKQGIQLIKEGATQGVSGVLISECAARNFPAANLLVQTSSPMEPAGSAKLLDKLSELVRIPVDTKPLLAEGKVIEQRIKDSMEKIKSLHSKYSQMDSNPAYG